MGVFRKRLREMMDEKGMRQADLVAATGIDRSLISSYFTGRYEQKDENLQAIAKALNCDAMWLMGYDGVEAACRMICRKAPAEARAFFLFHDLNVLPRRVAIVAAVVQIVPSRASALCGYTTPRYHRVVGDCDKRIVLCPCARP